MRPLTIRRAAADSTPVALRSKASLRTVLATAMAAAVGFAPAILIASPAAAAPVVGTYGITAAQAIEGNAIGFTITRSNTTASETVSYTTALGATTATAGDDFTAVTNGSVTLGIGVASQVVTIATLQDTADEVNETFTLTVRDPDNANAVLDSEVGTILDEDQPTYTLSATQSTVNEGNAGVGGLTTRITATLSQTPAENVTIPVATVAGTATAPQDFTAVTDSFTFTAGATGVGLTDYIDVTIVNDTVDEADVQSFTVVGTAGINVSGTQTTTVNIVDNDAAPVLTLGNATITEGGLLEFTPSLTGTTSENTITARWDTADGPAGVPNPAHGVARAGQDYTAVTNGTVTFAPGASSPNSPIRVTTLPDNLDEVSPENMSVVLSAPINASLGVTASGTGAINDSGFTTTPTISVTPTEIKEGGADTPQARTITVRLSKTSGQTQRVQYSVGAGTTGTGIQAATADVDFTAITTGELVFEPGDLEKTFTVNVKGDNVDENNGDNIAITLSQTTPTLSGGLVATQVLIADDDDKPALTLVRNDISVTETDGYAAALVTARLSNPSINPVTFSVVNATTAGTASEAGTGAGSDDYDLVPAASVTVQAGQTTGYAFVVINGDEVYEPDETALFTVARTGVGTNGDNATGAASTATVTIKNDDKAPVLAIANATVKEGASVPLTGTVTGVAQAATALSITFAGQAVDGSDPAEETDFVAPGPVLVSIPGGTASGTSIPVRSLVTTQDTVDEAKETIVVSGSGFGESGSVTRGVVTIEDDDEAPVEPPVTVAPTLETPPYRLGVGDLILTGKAGADATVDLWVAPVSGGTWAKVGSTKANAEGGYSFTQSFTNMGYRFQTRVGDKSSPERTVYLRHDPVLIANSPSKGVATLKVYADPKLAGLNVVMQWLNPTTQTWEKVGVGVTSTSGLVIKNITGLKTGTTYAFRGYVVGNDDMGLQGGYSGTRRVAIK